METKKENAKQGTNVAATVNAANAAKQEKVKMLDPQLSPEERAANRAAESIRRAEELKQRADDRIKKAMEAAEKAKAKAEEAQKKAVKTAEEATEKAEKLAKQAEERAAKKAKADEEKAAKKAARETTPTATGNTLKMLYRKPDMTLDEVRAELTAEGIDVEKQLSSVRTTYAYFRQIARGLQSAGHLSPNYKF